MEAIVGSKRISAWSSATITLLIVVVAALALAAFASPARAANLTIDSIVVKLRDGVIANPAAGLPASEVASLRAAMQATFSQTGYTRDGAVQLQLMSPLPLDAARAAVNRVRMLPEVLYANVVAPPFATSGGAAAGATAAPTGPPIRRIIVKYKDASISANARLNVPLPQSQVNRLSTVASQPVTQERAMSGGAYVVRLFQALPIDQARAVAAAIASDASVEYAEADRLMQPTLAPNDPLYTSQWNYMSPPAETGGVNLPPAWDITTGAAGIVVAVIDTGSLPNHPDLAGRYIGGYDFISDSQVANDGDGRDADPSDPGDWITAAESASGYFAGCPVGHSSFHGTHVAGTIGAATNNGIGVTGINWVSKILPARVLGKCGGYLSDIADAIRWSAGLSVPGVPNNTNPARVLNLSLGGYACNGSGQNCGCDSTSQDAINAALAANAVVVIAAGNGNADAITSTPGNCNGVITVAATGRAGQRASYSNYGTLVEISAPGGADGQYVLSTLNSGATSPDPNGYNYVYYQGTSMATPHVSGIASLMMSRNPALTPSQVLSTIQTTARVFPTGTGRDCTTALCGAGIIDAGAAVLSAGGVTTSTTTLVGSPNPAIAGVSVTFTATVSGTSPTGTVSFKESGVSVTNCNGVTLTGSGNSRTATCSTSALAVGIHSIVANYSGDSGNTSSSSAPLSQVINVQTLVSTTTLTSSQNPGIAGTSVTFTATVSGSNPTGSVAFTESGNPICPAGTLAGSPAIASCSTSGLTLRSHSIIASYGGDAANAASASAAVTQAIIADPSATTWVDDAVPTGASTAGDGGDSWNWVSSNPSPFSGALAHQSAVSSGLHQHYFYNATATLAVGVGDTLFAYVYLDPANPPSEVMLQWNDGSWEHRAYWGANLITAWGTDGTVSRRSMGALPATGQWVQLSVPAAQVGLEGRTLNGMAYTLYGGRATWDYAGKGTAPPPVTYQLSGTVAVGASALAGVAFTASSGGNCTASDSAGHYNCTVPQNWTGIVTPSLTGYSFTPPSRTYGSVAANQTTQDYAASVLPTYQLTGTVAVGASALAGVAFTASSGGNCTTSDSAGHYSCSVPQNWSGTVTPSLSGYSFTPSSRTYSSVAANQTSQDYAAAVNTAAVWVDDAVPTGASTAGDGGDSWNWVSSNPSPFSGALAHQSAVSSGLHQHYFYNATATLPIGVGDTLFAYVYLDPANPPSEVMLQWNDGSWEHRAYWGANSVTAWGTDGTVSRRYMGVLPATGQWVQLSVPAAQVGLEGHTLNGMAYTLYGGRATWDYAGKTTAPPPVTYQLSGTVAVGATALAGVSFTASNGGNCTTSDTAGHYSCTVPQNWSGTVTPSLTGYSFTPPSRTYSSVTANQTSQDYAASVIPTYQLTGTVAVGTTALAGVSFAASSGGSCTNSDTGGHYSCTVPQNWSGTVTPSLTGYSFTPPSRTYSSVTANQTSQDYAAAVNTATVWVDDAVPAGASTAGDGGDSWNWVSSNPSPFSGALAHQSAVSSGLHQHYFYNATATLAVGVGDTLFAYVYLDPANPPSEVMLQWNDGSWEHRAYWGANLITAWGTDGTVSRRSMGALPATGQWVQLSVPAAQVGLEGRTLNGMAYTLYGGRATWDYAGK